LSTQIETTKNLFQNNNNKKNEKLPSLQKANKIYYYYKMSAKPTKRARHIFGGRKDTIEMNEDI